MSLSTVYDVQARYRADTRGARSEMSALRREASGLERSINASKSALAMFGKIAIGVGTAAAAGGLAMLTRRAGQLQSQIEGARISLASVFNLNGLSTFEGGMRRATSLVTKFRQQAAKSMGGTMDFVTVAQNLMPQLSRMNPSDTEIQKLTGQGVGAAFSIMGGDTQQTGMDLQRMLGGQASMGENRLFTLIGNQLMARLGVQDTEGFNKVAKAAGGVRKVYEALVTTLGAFDKANERAANTMQGQWATFQDQIDSFLLRASEDLFGGIVERLKSANNWLDQNQDKVDQIARRVDSALVTGLDAAVNAASMLARHLDTVLVTMTAMGAAKFLGGGDMGAGLRTMNAGMSRGVSAVGGGALDLLGGFGGNVSRSGAAARSRLAFRMATPLQRAGMTVRGAGRAAMGAGRSAIGRLSMSALRATDAYSLATPLQRGGMLAKGAARGGAGAVARVGGALGLGKLGGALTGLLRVAGPVGLAIGAVVSVMDVLQDKTSDVGGFFWEMVAEMREALDSLASSFGFGGSEGGFMGMMKKLKTFVGEVLVLALSTGVMAITKFVEGINFVVDVVRAAAATFGEMYMQYDRAGGGLTGLRAIDIAAAADAAWKWTKQQRAKDDAQAEYLRKKREEEEEAKDDLKENVDTKPKLEVKVELHQTITTDASPDRIAFKTMDLIEEAFYNRRLSVPGGSR